MVDSDDESPPVPTYSEEQRALKEDLKSALNSVVGEEPLLTVRTKSDKEKVFFVFIEYLHVYCIVCINVQYL